MNEQSLDILVGDQRISAVLASPLANHHQDYLAKGYAPSIHKVVLILHGNAGHKNYCYHRMLLHSLLRDLGVYTVRFDFRNCGDSDSSGGPRTIDQDIEDIDSVVKYLERGGYKGINFVLSGIVGHSRGSAAMFLWNLRNRHYTPSLVNCAGRFDYSGHLTRIQKRYPNWNSERYYKIEGVYHEGSYKDVTIHLDETHSLAQIDLAEIVNLQNDVLSIYGLADTTVPLEDAASYANLLGSNHKLILIPNADHNYYGTTLTEGVSVPVNSRGQYNYNHLVVEHIKDFFSHEPELQRFYRKSHNIESISRWKLVDGIANFRDIGGWNLLNDEYIRPNFLFRSATPVWVTEEGRKAIRKLNIKMVFDFRSVEERERDGVLQMEGVEVVHLPVFTENGSPQNLMVLYRNLITSWATYKDIYRDMLEQGINSFKTVFQFIKDRPKDGFLYHCFAGKDRTGIMTMLIYLLCDLPHLCIAQEYELTTIGLRPLHLRMRQDYLKSISKFESKLEAVYDSVAQGRKGWSFEKDGFETIISSRSEAMLATIDMFNREFGGIIAYMKKMGFSERDIVQIRSNLVSLQALL